MHEHVQYVLVGADFKLWGGICVCEYRGLVFKV